MWILAVSPVQTQWLLTSSQSQLPVFLFLLDFFMLLMRDAKHVMADSFSVNMCFLICWLEELFQTTKTGNYLKAELLYVKALCRTLKDLFVPYTCLRKHCFSRIRSRWLSDQYLGGEEESIFKLFFRTQLFFWENNICGVSIACVQ